MTPLEKMLVEHEGLCLDLYRDTASPPRCTIGVGRNLSDVGLRDEEAGCTVPQISTISGHSLASVNKILEKYLARTMRLAKSATARLGESKLFDFVEEI